MVREGRTEMPLWKRRKLRRRRLADRRRRRAAARDVRRRSSALKRWRERARRRFQGRNAPLGLLIAPGSDWNDIAGDLPRFPVIAVTIPKYADGRAFLDRPAPARARWLSPARSARSGIYIIDQVPLMRRVGIDAFQTSDPILIRRSRPANGPRYRTTSSRHSTGAAEVPAGTRPWARKRAGKD